VTAEFSPTEKSRLRRKPQLAAYDEATIFAILDAGLICHVGYVVDGEPLVTPTAYWREGRRLYWHGAAAGRMIGSQAAGVPVCVTVSHVDGLVVARSGIAHTLHYRSVMAFGRTVAITDPDEKRRAMANFINRVFPGRWPELRPVNAAELAAITVIGMTIEQAAAKTKGGDIAVLPGDLDYPCWMGVLPISLTVGQARPDRRNTTPMPESVAAYQGVALEDVLARYANGYDPA
jgi:nitroimidazol reductase NimA-like FMN-containing flavoprotein (pyridoxamine 5'-phosphate oxidase superfamily)